MTRLSYAEIHRPVPHSSVRDGGLGQNRPRNAEGRGAENAGRMGLMAVEAR